MTARDRVGLQRYSDCHADCYADESTLTCATWAHHASLSIVSMKRLGQSESIDLDRAAVQQLVGQLQEWLKK
jgi:hypothetical protein